MPTLTHTFNQVPLDANGNLTSDGSRNFSWDSENRLVQVTDNKTSPATVTTFEYDAMWRRVRILEKQGTQTIAERKFVWDGANIVEERDGSGQVVKKRYFENGMKIESGSKAGNYFYAKDHLRSIRSVTDGGGTVRATYDFDLWGRRSKIAGDVDADFGFTGYFSGTSTNFAFPMFRAYEPDLGAWISRDPWDRNDGHSLFAYAQGNPVSNIDPSGLKIQGPSGYLEDYLRKKAANDCSDRDRCQQNALDNFHTCNSIVTAGWLGCNTGVLIGCLAVPGYVECVGPGLLLCFKAQGAGRALCGVILLTQLEGCALK